MKNTPVIFLLTLFFTQILTAQTAQLGGIVSAKFWAIAKKQGNEVGLQIQTPTQNFFQKLENTAPVEQQIGQINRHPALFFEGRIAQIRVPLPADFSKMTCLAVVAPSDTFLERAVWFFEKNSAARLLAATRHFADLDAQRFFKLGAKNSLAPQIFAFQQFKNRDSLPVASQHLVVGQPPAAPQNALPAFAGLLAEILIFDRVLSPGEQQKIETNLALKYGIALTPQPSAAFVAPDGKLLHGGRAHRDFGWRVAGIGRDSAAAFFQNFSENTSEPALVSVAAGFPESGDSGYFWLWGDDNSPTRFADLPTGEPNFIQRKWKMRSTGASQNLTAAVRLDTRRADADLPEGKIWWLASDHSGTGKFAPADTDFFPMSRLDGAAAVFENVRFSSGETVFSFAAAPAFFVQTWIEKPRCQPAAAGKMQVVARGGQPPFQFVLENEAANFLKKWTADAPVLIENLPAQNFRLAASDAAGAVFRDTFFVENADAPRSKIFEKMRLPADGSPLVVDAAADFDKNDLPNFQWQGAGGFESNFPKIEIREAGVFWLTVEQAGCLSRQILEVLPAATPDVFRKIRLLPNPAPAGKFQLEIGLETAAAVEIEISDVAGRLVFSRRLDGSDFYLTDVDLDAPAGVFWVAVSAGGARRGLRLVVL